VGDRIGKRNPLSTKGKVKKERKRRGTLTGKEASSSLRQTKKKDAPRDSLLWLDGQEDKEVTTLLGDIRRWCAGRVGRMKRVGERGGI